MRNRLLDLRNGAVVTPAELYCAGLAVPLAVALKGARWPLLGIWLAGAVVRGHGLGSKVVADCVYFLLAHLLAVWYSRDPKDKAIWKESDLWNHQAMRLAATCVLGGAMLVYLASLVRRSRAAQKKASDLAVDGETAAVYPKALIFPCHTTHARFFPQKHKFDYSYLLYGIPITPPQSEADNETFGHVMDVQIGKWWMSVRAEDYLERGLGYMGFFGKLRETLRRHGVKDSEWSFAYLVTAPRILGYSFNPVSFWYIYDDSHELKRMILEVNNTFGERRIYLLDGTSLNSAASTPTSETAQDDTMKPKSKAFRDAWMKDFHVSPFNSRKGSYALRAINPFPASNTTDTQIDNTITLKSSKDHAKIVARIYSTTSAIEAHGLGVLGTARFIAGWWWVGLMTFPRILREASKLYFKRSLHVWFRPEVLSSSVGRLPTPTEITLQRYFSSYLQDLIRDSPHQWEIVYHTAIASCPTETLTYSPEARDLNDKPPKYLEIKVLNPVFYTRFVHYAHTCEAFDRECLFTAEKNRTIWISDPALLPLLMHPKSSSPTSSWPRNHSRSRLEELRWKVLRIQRCPPAEPAYPTTPQSSEFDIDDIRALPFSDLDKFVRREFGEASPSKAAEYRRLVTKVFLAQRLTLGFVEVLDLLDFCLRVLLVLIAVWCVRAGKMELENSHGATGDFVESGKAFLMGFRHETWRSLTVMFGACACHLYALAKGYT